MNFAALVRRGLVVATAIAAMSQTMAETPAAVPVRVLYPPDKSVVGTNFMVVMALAPSAETQPSLKLDGRPLVGERLKFSPDWIGKTLRFQPTNAPNSAIEVKPKTHALWLAIATFTPGPHVLEAGGARVEFYRNTFPDLVNAPAGFQYFHKHQRRKPQLEALACDTCHDIQKVGDSRALGDRKSVV
jgi:hypothetical protein